MSNTIFINPNELRSRANQLRNIASEDKDNITRLTNLILNIDDVWRGDASSAFVNKYQSQKVSFDELYNLLNDYANLLDNCANKMEEKDRELRNRIRSAA